MASRAILESEALDYFFPELKDYDVDVNLETLTFTPTIKES
jgi:hypothetical protein